ncbi:cell envelope biogenesis protein OmpA [Croceiramulus getboli]|nr:cell envelope biogenesis protein OmpA [Flavobacteriaceae bacterium YJPT1-3]
MNSEERLDILKEILLTDDREFARKITRKVAQLEEQQSHLNERVEPVINAKLQDFVVEIPKTLGPTITQALRTEIRKSQDAVAEALYPILGKMIKKYVQNEIAVLQENISRQIDEKFTFVKWFQRRKKREEDALALIGDQYKPRIEQILVIEKGSGILKASYAKTRNLDPEVVSGMLTAIKSFVEDAFHHGSQNLEAITYELYTLHIQNFSKYYMVVALSGVYSATFKSDLEDVLLEFAQRVINKDDLDDPEALAYKLEKFFTDERI